jgi:hypothetical protein
MKSLRVVALLAAGTVLSTPALAPAQWQTPARPQQQQAQPSLVGTWNGQINSQQGSIPITAQYRANGTFDAVMQMPVPGYTGSMYMHFWGRYRTQSQGQGRYSLQLQPVGQAPSEVCQAFNHGPPQSCQPTTMSQPSTGWVQFFSANSFQDETGGTYTRINGLGMLAQRVPARLVLNTNGGDDGGVPYVSPYRGGGDGTVTVQHPGNLQQERICTINDGTLVTYPDGREECKGPN